MTTDPNAAFNEFIADQVREAVERAITTVQNAEEVTYRDLLIARGWTPPDHEGELRAAEIAKAGAMNERLRASRRIKARLAVLGPLRDGYGRGCVHGLDHALHMVEDRPHPADPH
jgi:hypothetical protein